MPRALLPSSAIAFAPRSPPNVVLNAMFPGWLTAKLKQINRFRRPLNNYMQHTQCLREILSQDNANWTLCSIMLPKTPEAKTRNNVTDMFLLQMIHIEGYVVHVDMVSRNEVAFKLCQETIEALVEFHQEVFLVNAAENTKGWREKQAQLHKLQEEFVEAANKFVFRTKSEALVDLEQDGSGELLVGMSEKAKKKIIDIFQPLVPPPCMVDAGQIWMHPPIYPSMLVDLEGCGPEPWPILL